MIRTVPVALGDRSYDVRIGPGLIARAGDEIAPLLSRPRVAVLTDERVAALHLPALTAALERAGIRSSALALPAGEATKSWDHLGRAVEWLLAERIERRDIVIALGGGVIGQPHRRAGRRGRIQRRQAGIEGVLVGAERQQDDGQVAHGRRDLRVGQRRRL